VLTTTAVASTGTPPKPAIGTSRGVVVAVPVNTRTVGNAVKTPGVIVVADALTGGKAANTATRAHDDKNARTVRRRPLMAKTPSPPE